MGLRHIISILFFVIILLVMSQCTFTKKVVDGRSAYNLKQYAVAIDYFEEELKNEKDRSVRAQSSFLLAESYRAIKEYAKSIPWYKEAVKQNYGPQAMKQLGLMLKTQENYTAATKIFQQFQKEYGQDPEVNRELAICKQAAIWSTQLSPHKISVKRSSFNSVADDYSPRYYSDDYIAFTSDRNDAIGASSYNWTGNSFSDIFLVDRHGGDAVSFDIKLNTPANEGTACFSKNFKTVYFTRCFAKQEGDEYCKIMVSYAEEDEWSEPEVMPFVKGNFNYGHPTLIENDSVMVFTISAVTAAQGYDLYYSYKDAGSWSEAIAMPSSINTQGDEKFPTSDGDTLYFSSNYHPGLGGYDIFKTYLRNDNSWANPENIQSPFNSGSDDFGLIKSTNASRQVGLLEEGYFSSSRNSGTGDDIFRYEIRLREPDLQDTFSIVKEEPVDQRLYLAIKVVENIYEDPADPNSDLIDKKALPEALLELSFRDSLDILKADQDGRVIIELMNTSLRNIKARLDGYLSNSETINESVFKLNEGETEKTINIEIALDPLVLDKEIELSNIFYDFDRWDIREDAKPSLNELAKILADNPDLSVQLGSHTDCQGNDAYNANLSKKRAQSAMKYLISTGITPSRLSAKGYGETKLSNLCECDSCTEEEHQENRRTTFKLTS